MHLSAALHTYNNARAFQWLVSTVLNVYAENDLRIFHRIESKGYFALLTFLVLINLSNVPLLRVI